ncbi:restriction endonuclease [Pseudomonas sp. DSV-1]|uniref:restriction endonuclease n=1 Tax=Pseudomonas sp. DSV-1 TaxID=3112250 RepID=UPI002DBAC13A|nr:restriction endonuclease [Pseudomonas sp. DSV-1]MEC4242092.1 restriction endonuclease [Pseudomonas sp. DSV-1]
MAKRNTALNDLIHIASMLPWWICLACAVASGLYLHTIAIEPVVVNPSSFDFTPAILKGVASVAQYVAPMIFVFAAILSIAKRFKRSRLLNSANNSTTHSLAGYSWKDFELLVGESLRRQGFAIQEAGGGGPDGGVDLIARKDAERFLVQCKHWRSMQVGVSVVRELYGVMAAEGAAGGFVVTSGKFTKPAREFAKGRNLHLVDGQTLAEWIAATKRSPAMPDKARVEPAVNLHVDRAVPRNHEPEPEPQQSNEPSCPLCRKSMVNRTAKSGANVGRSFWGCMDFPKCRGVRHIP